MKRFFLFSIIVVAALNASTQSCYSGKIDPRVAAALRFELSDLPSSSVTSVEQIRDVKISTPVFPKSDVQYIRITADSISIQVYNQAHGTGLPIMISYHPGGFVTPMLPFMEYESWRQSGIFNAIVFAIDYRVAPENKFPAAVDDAYNAFKWIIKNGQAFGGDTSRIVLSGSSAGGNLAAVVSQRAKSEGIAAKIKLQILNCPSTDDPRNFSKHPSYQKYASGYFLTKDFCQYYIRMYAPHESLTNPEIGPLNNEDMSGLPPTVVITAEFDPLRDEGAAYAKRLREAGVPLWYKCFPGQIHCLLGLPPKANELLELDNLIIKAMDHFLD